MASLIKAVEEESTPATPLTTARNIFKPMETAALRRANKRSCCVLSNALLSDYAADTRQTPCSRYSRPHMQRILYTTWSPEKNLAKVIDSGHCLVYLKLHHLIQMMDDFSFTWLYLYNVKKSVKIDVQ